jgi:outer membrane protein TolC
MSAIETLTTLDIRRQLAKTDPAAYQPGVALTLNNLARLYYSTQRMKEAETAYQEALDIRRQLAKTNRTLSVGGLATNRQSG